MTPRMRRPAAQPSGVLAPRACGSGSSDISLTDHLPHHVNEHIHRIALRLKGTHK